jgi:3-methyladenine DNA glycosylase/8-oxoguanine DNA glycosylase
VASVSRVRLSVSKPFSLKGTVLGYGYWELPPFHWDGAVLRRAESLDGDVHLLAIRESPSGSRGWARLVLSLLSRGRLSPAARRELVRRTRTMLGLDHDLREFYALCRREPRLRRIPRLGLGRLLRGTTLFEDLVKTITWTNTTWAQAVKMIGKLGALGDSCPVVPRFRAWPGPARILEAGPRYLEREAKLGYRTAYILELAERVVGGDLDLEGVEAIREPEVLAKALLGIKGVGPASAAYLLAMLGHHDRPILDSATLAYLARTYFRGRTPSSSQVERRLARYGRWKGRVMWFDYWLGRKEP